jgi:hypothetical protein
MLQELHRFIFQALDTQTEISLERRPEMEGRTCWKMTVVQLISPFQMCGCESWVLS